MYKHAKITEIIDSPNAMCTIADAEGKKSKKDVHVERNFL